MNLIKNSINLFFSNLDLYDVEKTVKEVTRQMGTNPIISYPAECDFTLLNSFIREVAKIAFEMQAVDPKISISYATDGELFNEKKYVFLKFWIIFNH